MKFLSIKLNELIWLVLSVVTLGLCLSFLDLVAFGTDPFTTFNLAISQKLNLSFGNWQSFLNCVLFVFVFFLAKDQIGWGTLANMFLVGYSFDFFSWINSMLLPENLFEPMIVRILVTIPALGIFILAAAIYMAIQQGTAPYDAIPYIISSKKPKIPFKLIRMGWDISVCILGIIVGGKAGIVTFIMAFTIGPAISFAEKNIVTKLLHIK